MALLDRCRGGTITEESKRSLCPTSWTEKDKKFISLAETKDGKREELDEIAYEVNGDKLTLTSPKALEVGKGGKPVEMSEEWERKKADKKWAADRLGFIA
jgi:hypothetical protein